MGYFLGLGGPYYHDTSACLVDGRGRIIAFAEEERFTRRKHNKDSRSCARAAAFCLAQAGIRLEDVVEIAVGWNPQWPRRTAVLRAPELIEEMLNPQHFGGYNPTCITTIEHHVAHAASAFYCSGFPDAAVLVVDGSGDGIATSLFRGNAQGLVPLRQYPFTQSLGWFYETVAEHLGLGDWTSAGKLMGLAAYGDPLYDFEFLHAAKGDYRFDLSRYGIAPEEDARDAYTDLSYYRRLKRAYRAAFDSLGVSVYRRDLRYDTASGGTLANTGFDSTHANLAASAQRALESCLEELARAALAEAGSTRLCIAGGVAMNCTANGALWRRSGARELFVQPVAGDAGCAIGAALECARRAGVLALPGKPLVSTALGPSFNDEQIRRVLDVCRLDYTHHEEDIVRPVAQAIAAGAIAGWFQGPLEGGPRALGHRSILGDPRRTETRDRLNRDVKRREMWRPLAPSILSTDAAGLLKNQGPAEFMIIAYEASERAHADIPATIHVDGSVRPQVVTQAGDPLYARLLASFRAETGVAALLNTSFNHEAEPIVCTPIDAIRTFFSTPIDLLAIGGFLLTKNGRGQGLCRGARPPYLGGHGI